MNLNPREYRPVVKIPKEVSATTDATFYTRITLFEDINLATGWLNIDLIQGGNRIGTASNKDFVEGDTGTLTNFFYNVANPASF